jgi:hypothetical protein
VNKRSQASAVSGGIFLIGLGVLIFTGWWWPGILVVIGLSGGAELIFRGKVGQGISTLAFFCAIPIVLWIIQRAHIPWAVAGPLVLIGIGVIMLVKTVFLREPEQEAGQTAADEPSIVVEAKVEEPPAE